MIDRIRIGTRGSKLALIQTEKVKNALEEKFPGIKIEITIIKTKGDRIMGYTIPKIGDRGIFVGELENSLLSRDIDLAVHSLKDLPTRLAPGLILGGVLEREDPRDALLSINGKKLQELGIKDTIATSSLRRKAQLLRYNRDLKIIEIGGNIDTRLKKMEAGYCTALVLALAGLKRAGFEDKITEVLDTDTVMPAAGQGIIAVEIRRDDFHTAEFLRVINHEETMLFALAERAFLDKLGGGCEVPIGCLASGKPENYTIMGFISDLEGKRVIKEIWSVRRENLVKAAENFAERILNYGGREIIRELKQNKDRGAINREE